MTALHAPAWAGDSIVVAIDGPAGSGKSSVSKQAARELGYGYLDTGAAYRALGWWCLTEPTVGIQDAAAIVAALPRWDYRISTDPDDFWVRVGAADVTHAIREPRISIGASTVAQIPAVRAFLVELFRRIVREAPVPGVVVEGRDITTVVAPDAQVRLLLTADEEVRIARRAGELAGQDAAATSTALKERDARDSKMVNFLTAADGVTTLDSTDLDFDATVAAVVGVVRTALG